MAKKHLLHTLWHIDQARENLLESNVRPIQYDGEKIRLFFNDQATKAINYLLQDNESLTKMLEGEELRDMMFTHLNNYLHTEKSKRSHFTQSLYAKELQELVDVTPGYQNQTHRLVKTAPAKDTRYKTWFDHPHKLVFTLRKRAVPLEILGGDIEHEVSLMNCVLEYAQRLDNLIGEYRGGY